MTNEQILKKAIEKAVKNGFEIEERYLPNILRNVDSKWWIYPVIFSHDFAKAFVRYLLTDEFLTKPYGVMKVKRLGFVAGRKKENNIEIMKNNFLQEMVLEKEPLLYLKQFLDEIRTKSNIT